MSEPKRIQLSRKAGWRMPVNTVSVARPGKWGNPYRVGAIDHRTGGFMDANTAVERFLDKMLRQGREAEIISALRGKNLACWCKLVDQHGNPMPCHADVLLELANAPTNTGEKPS